MKVDVVVWFSIKHMPQLCKGSEHFFLLIKSCHSLTLNIQEISYNCISQNVYFGHCESILLLMLYDNDNDIRKKALEVINKEKSKAAPSHHRKFKMPSLNFQANYNYELIS